MKALGKIFFKYRSYTPLPFIFVMILFVDSNITNIFIGLFIVTLGELIRIWAASYTGSEARTTYEFGGTNLVTQGPYSYLRNPMYLSNVIIYTGIGIMSSSLFPYLQIFALVFFTFQYYCIISSEEEYLDKRFNGLYDNYKKNVRRFFPKKNSIPFKLSSDLSFNLNAGLRSEKRSLQALIAIAILILFFYFFDTTLPDLFRAIYNQDIIARYR